MTAPVPARVPPPPPAGKAKNRPPAIPARQAGPGRRGTATDWPCRKERPFTRNGRSAHLQRTLTATGGEAIPLATTTSVLLPAGVPRGRVKSVADLAPGATDTEVQCVVRA